jgi:hypothetical protein
VTLLERAVSAWTGAMFATLMSGRAPSAAPRMSAPRHAPAATAPIYERWQRTRMATAALRS